MATEQVGSLRRVLGGLKHRAIAGGDSGGERHQAQAHGVVPWRYDADDAQRLEHDSCSSRSELHGDPPSARAHPAPNIPTQIVDAVDRRHDLHDRGLVGGPVAKVGIDRGFEILAPGEDRGPELQQNPTGAAPPKASLRAAGVSLGRQDRPKAGLLGDREARGRIADRFACRGKAWHRRSPFRVCFQAGQAPAEIGPVQAPSGVSVPLEPGDDRAAGAVGRVKRREIP